MKAFMDQDFLLETETAKMLYHDYAATVSYTHLTLPTKLEV